MFLLDFVEIPIVYLQPINTVLIYLITLIKAFLGNQKSMNQLPDPEKFALPCSLVHCLKSWLSFHILHPSVCLLL